MMKITTAFLALSILSALSISSRGGLLQNDGFEVEYPSGQSTNWWWYGEAGRATWAMRSGAAGQAFYAASTNFGGFGQDVPVDISKGRVFTFTIYGKAEANYTNGETTVGMEFWTGSTQRYTVTQNVYAQLDANRDAWTQISLVETAEVTDVDLIKIRCDFSDCWIPIGTSAGTCQWDDSSLTQSGDPTSYQLAKFEPSYGVYLGVLLDQGGTPKEIQEFNRKAGRRHAVFAKFVVLKTDPFPRDWVESLKTNCPGAAAHLVLEPMVDFQDFYASDWGPGQSTYEAALSFATNCAHSGLPIFLRFGHEANGDWYPWHPEYSTRYGIPDTISNETYIAAWRNFADLIHTHATNVAMVWAPNQGNGPWPLPFYGDVYPGDDYVDWVGLSVYNGDWYGNQNDVYDYQFKNAIQRGYWQANTNTLDDTFEDFYWEFSDPDNPQGHHKPMMIAETSAQFIPQYHVTNELIIADFESLVGPQFTASNTIAEFQSLSDDGLTASHVVALDNLENLARWNWGVWTDLFFSNTADRVQGTNAALLGAKSSYSGGDYVGGTGRDLTSTNLSSFNGLVLQVKRASSAEPDPLLVIGLRSPGATATVSKVITSTSYSPLKVYFSELTTHGSFTLTSVNALTLELITTVSGQRPGNVWVDQWSCANIAASTFDDQDWWPQGTNTTPWGDGADSQGGWHTWELVSDPATGLLTNSLRLSGFDANTNSYLGGNGCSLRDAYKDWSYAECISLLARKGDITNADPILSISLRDGTGLYTAQVSQVVVSTNYTSMVIPFSDMNCPSGFQWSNVSVMVFEMLSGTAGERASDLYIKQLQIGSVSNLSEQNWNMAGNGYQPWGESTWTQSTDAVSGTYALEISGVVTGSAQWYIGGNGCSMPIPQQNWSNSSALLLYLKQGDEANRVEPNFKITLDNDYAETNGNEATVNTKVANTNYTEVVIAFDDFHVDDGFTWTNVRMFKIELFTSDAGENPNALYLDQLRRATVTLTNNEDNLRWKSAWCDQLFALSDYADADPADPDANPDYASIFANFRNLHMINWFHIRKFEDGMTKDLKIAAESTDTIAYTSYYGHIQSSYFLTNIVLDSDSDGLPDDWEQQHFGNPTSADGSQDSDADGFSNLQEYMANTDPTSSNALLEVEGDSNVTSDRNGFVINWQSAPWRVYTLESSSNLMEGFSVRARRITATPPLNSYTDTVSEITHRFYRIGVLP